MAELCLICKKRMHVGDAYKISAGYDDSFIGYTHRKCLDEKLPIVSKEEGF